MGEARRRQRCGSSGGAAGGDGGGGGRIGHAHGGWDARLARGKEMGMGMGMEMEMEMGCHAMHRRGRSRRRDGCDAVRCDARPRRVRHRPVPLLSGHAVPVPVPAVSIVTASGHNRVSLSGRRYECHLHSP